MAKLRRDWWARRKAEQQAAQIPAGDLRVSGEAPEAVQAEGIPSIPLTFRPTNTINPPRPRTVAAGYDPRSQTLRLQFRPGASSQSPGGAVYDYRGVTMDEWEDVKITISTGRYLNRQLAAKDYTRIY